MLPTVLMYHGVSSDLRAGFEQQIAFLARHCRAIRPENYRTEVGSIRRPAVLLTFDDGFRNNADLVAPILMRHKVPAVFFISSRHCKAGKYLWFTYLRMLERFFPGDSIHFEGATISLRGEARSRGIQELTKQILALRPHPWAGYEAMESQLPALESFVPAEILADEAQGTTADQIRELANCDLFTIGGHTVDHPQLTLCSEDEVERQMLENKAWLEATTGKRCALFAYPQANFNSPIAQKCRHAGFEQAFTTESTEVAEEGFAIPRIGVYAMSLGPLAVKAWMGNYLPFGLRTAVARFREQSQRHPPLSSHSYYKAS